MSLNKDSKIIVVGGGTFGLSTALWLLRKDYKNVTVLDPYPVPSYISAANDVNKIIQTSYFNEFHEMLARETFELWKTDEVFKNQFHEVGIVYVSDTKEGYKKILERNERREKLGKELFRPIENHEQFKEVFPQLSGEAKGWRGLYQPDEAGWAHARNSLISAGNEIIKLGGEIRIGEVNGLIEGDGVVKGVKTKQGEEYFGDKIIIAAGASSINVLNFQDQMLAKCWTFGHIKLSQEEADKLRDIPVILNSNQGFFFEPDSNNELKVCNETPGFTHYISKDENPESSVPFAKDAIPYECEVAIRDILRATLPEYAERELINKKICWCTDTPNRYFLIDEHPDYNGSLVLATGDSGHGFKFMPLVGKYVSELVIKGKTTVDKEIYDHWRWRPETSKNREQNRIGGSGRVKDLSEIEKWS